MEIYALVGSTIFEADKIDDISGLFATSPVDNQIAQDTIKLSVYVDADDNFTPAINDEVMIYGVQQEPYSIDIFGSIQYVQKIEELPYFGSDLKKVTITATNVMGIIAKQTHKGGIYPKPDGTEVTVGEILEEIFGDYYYNVDVDSAIENTVAKGWLPYGNSLDNLRKLLFPYGAIIKYEYGFTRITYGVPTTSKVIPAAKTYDEGATISTSHASRISVVEHNYIARTNASWEYPLQYEAGDQRTSGVQTVVFGKPVCQIETSGTAFTVIEQGANFITVNVADGTDAGYVRIKPYTDVTATKSSDTGATDGDGSEITADCTMVSWLNSDNLLGRLAAFYGFHKEVQIAFAYTKEEVGDRIDFYDAHGDVQTGYIAQLKIDPSPGTTKCTAVVVTNWQPGRLGNLYNHYIAYLGMKVRDGSIQEKYLKIQDGVPLEFTPGETSLPLQAAGKQVRIEIINGGEGGTGGEDGQAGGDQYSSSTSALGGEGGDGDIPGNPGKHRSITLTSCPASAVIDPGYNGIGSTKHRRGEASHDPVPSKAATITINGQTYSSADAAATSGIISNIITGQRLCIPGSAGHRGGKGGRGYSESGHVYRYAMDGESVETDAGIFAGGSAAYSMGGGGAADGKPGEAPTRTKAGKGATPAAPATFAWEQIGWGGSGGSGGGGGGGGVDNHPGGDAGSGMRGQDGGPGAIIIYW